MRVHDVGSALDKGDKQVLSPCTDASNQDKHVIYIDLNFANLKFSLEGVLS